MPTVISEHDVYEFLTDADVDSYALTGVLPDTVTVREATAEESEFARAHISNA